MRARNVICASIYVAALALQALFAANGHASAGIPNVVVTLPAIFPLVEATMRSAGKPRLLTQANQDPHTMHLTPRQAEMLQDADILIIGDRGMNAPMLRRIQKSARRNLTIIALTELPGADPKPYRTTNAYGGHTRRGGGGLDPHVWLDPLRMSKMLPALAARLGVAMPYAEETLRLNAENLSLHLRDTVHPALKDIFANITPAQTPDLLPYITYHDAFHYFETRYGLASYGFVVQAPEEHLGAAAMQSLLEASRSQRVHCLIAEGKSPLVTRLQLTAEAKLVLLSPERAYGAKEAPSLPWALNDYDRLLGKTAKTFAGCVEGKLAR
jgi:zinc transport system substrate-binding protein